jgi:hypothetical protein
LSQSEQEDKPVKFEALPTEQGWHPLAPTLAIKKPGKQSVQTDEPVVDANVPVKQRTQLI